MSTLTASQIEGLRALDAAARDVDKREADLPGPPPRVRPDYCWVSNETSVEQYVIHSSVARALEERGLAVSEDIGRIADNWVYRLTDAGRKALDEGA